MGDFLNRKEYEQLKKDFLTYSIKSESLEKNFSILAKNIELICLSKICNDTYVEDVIWIFHQYRIHKDNKKIKEILINFIEKVRKYINLPENELLKDHYEEIFNSLVRISVLCIMEENGGISPSINSCLTTPEKEEINNFLLKYKSVDLDDNLLEIENTTQFEDIDKFKKYDNLLVYISYIKKLQNIAISNDTKAPIAEASLKYLLDPNDIIPDRFGIVGLVDDFYAIREGIRLTDEENDFTSLVKIHDEIYKDFKLPNIDGSEKSLNIINLEKIVKASYIKKENDVDIPLKRLIILKNIGNIPIFSAIGKSLTNRIAVSKKRINTNFQKFERENEIILGYITKKSYGKEISRPIVAKYIGSIEKQESITRDLHFIEGSNGRITISNEFLNNCKLNYDQQKISSIKEINDYINGNTRDVLPWKSTSFCKGIESLPSSGKIIFFGTKNKFLTMFDEKIFGIKIKDWLGLRVIDKDWNKTDTKTNYLFPEPQLIFVSDKDVAYKILDNNWKNNLNTEIDLVISPDDEFNKDNYFLQLLTNFPKDVIAFSAYYNNSLKKEFANRGYYILPAKAENIISFIPRVITTETEKYLFRSQVFKKNLIITSPDTILEKLRKAIPEKVDDDYKILRIKIKSFVLNRSIRIIPLEGEDLEKEKLKLMDIINEIEFSSKFIDEFLNIKKLIKDNFDEIVSFSKIDIILNQIKRIDKKNKIAILSPSNQVKKINNYLNIHNFKKVTAISYSALKKNFKIDNLLISYFRRAKESISLRNEKFAKEHIFLMSETEANIHKRMEDYEEKLLKGNKLNSDDSNYLENEVIEFEKVVDDLIPYDEIMQDTKKFISMNYRSENDEINSKVLMFEDCKVHIVPENGSKLFIKNSNNTEVIYDKILNINVGDKILLPLSQDNIANDLLKTILIKDGNIEEYILLEKRAKAWQLELLNFFKNNKFSIRDLKENLAEHNLLKDTATLRNWLNENDFIIPKFKEKVIDTIFRLNSQGNVHQIDDCIKSNNQMIQLRSSARNLLKEEISKIKIKEDQLNFTISIGSLNLSYGIKEVVSISEAIVSSGFLYKTHDLNELKT